MKIILNQDVPNLGEEGDVCVVKDGYARNYLLPTGAAVLYNNENLSIFKSRAAAIEKRKVAKREASASLKEKLDNRKQSVKPLVDAYFAWIKTKQQLPCSSSKLKEAMNYAVYQEKYLRRFLDDPELPMDNNDAERSIRSFCVGKHNWHIIDSVNGAKASAFLYSIAESAKANGLKPYEYFRYLLSELVKHPRDNVPEDVLNRIMPWSEELPDCCRKTKTR
jgi:hypothetical protein